MKDRHKTSLLSCSEKAIQMAAALIREGEPVAVPTETVYGLAADATNEDAIGKIYAAKGRPSFNPLIVHVGRDLHSTKSLIERGLVDGKRLTPQAAFVADRLLQAFWPGPFTVVLPRGSALPARVAGGLTTVGFRMPRHPAFLDLIEASGVPLAAPSANRSNRISPTTAAHVMEELAGRIALVLDGGAAPVGVESTIVRIHDDGSLELLRPGGLPLEDITSVSGMGITQLGEHHGEQPLAPGMLKLHYAPTKPMLLVAAGDARDLTERLSKLGQVSRVGILSFGSLPATADALGLINGCEVSTVVELPPDDGVVAAALFDALRRLDHSEAHVIVAEFPTHRAGGLWPAICDRLSRGQVANR